MKCHWRFECAGLDSATGAPIFHPDKKALIREDTNEVVEVRDISEDERQLALPLPAADDEGDDEGDDD